MSYDLMVFNAEVAPNSATEFMAWYDKQTEWAENHDYDDPKVCEGNLKNWFEEMNTIFPALNGPYTPPDVDDRIDNDDDKLTDYSIGTNVIYAAFRYSVAEDAFTNMINLAEKYNVGFFDASGEGEILIPNESGSLININNKSKWWKFW